MDCPVCQHSGIDEKALKCSVCNSDLEGFHHLKKIDIKTKTQKRTILLLLIMTLIFLCGFIVVLSGPKETFGVASSNQNDELKMLKNENEALKNKIEGLEQQVEESRETSVNEVVEKEENREDVIDEKNTNSAIHVVQAGETLSNISEKLLGSPDKYKQIAKDNGINDPHLIIVGQELKIIK